jgi:3-oxoacyl-[acyl-carrier protein] reductase
MSDVLKDKIALVTGSGQGIGRSIALAFAAEGAKVVTNNRKPGSAKLISDGAYRALTPEKQKEYDDIHAGITGDAETTAQAIKDMGGDALPVYADISKAEDVDRMVTQAVSHYGTIHILVNVAGLVGGGSFTDISETQWDQLNNIKPKGYFLMMKAVLPYMVKQHWGRVINTTSRAMMGDVIKMADYCTANAAVVGLSQGAACEFFHEGITVNAFSPWARTGASCEQDFDAVSEKAIPGMREYSHAAVTSAAEAVPPLLLYLCTDAADKITGLVFSLAGKEIALRHFPLPTRTIKKSGTDIWTLDELKKQAPRFLFKDYRNILEVQ